MWLAAISAPTRLVHPNNLLSPDLTDATAFLALMTSGSLPPFGAEGSLNMASRARVVAMPRGATTSAPGVGDLKSAAL